MIGIAGLLAAGGILATGTMAYRKLKADGLWFRRQEHIQVQPSPALAGDDARGDDESARANRTLLLSSAALGATTAGLFFKPILMLASVPIGIYIFAPTFHAAWHSLYQERRISTPVLDATRVTACVVMGYHFTLALDTWFRTVVHKVLLRTENDFAQTLNAQFVPLPNDTWLFIDGAEVQTALTDVVADDIISVVAGDLIPIEGTVLHGTAWVEERLVTGKVASIRKGAGDTIHADTTVVMGQAYVQVAHVPKQLATGTIRKVLCRTIEAGSFMQHVGEASGRKMAPRMLATFAIMLPFWEVNRAAGFLTTSFGSQMGHLGRYTLQNFVTLATQQQLLILDGHALEYLNLVNTIVIDADLLSDPTLRAQAKETIGLLRQRKWPIQSVSPQPFAVYLVTRGDKDAVAQLAAEVGADDCFVEPLVMAQAALIERWQRAGRLVCYIGHGHTDALIIDKALIAVVMPAVGGTIGNVVESDAQIVLIEKDLTRLDDLFTVATQFAAKQGFNLAWPLLMDLLDIGTTVFIHFGLTYSLLFSYGSTLVSAVNARLPLLRHRRMEEATRNAQQLPQFPRSPATTEPSAPRADT